MKNIFRIVAFLEGVSYILLLFVAVPIKYYLDEPGYVKLLGMPHGILFISYIIMCFTTVKYEKPKWVLRKNNWPKGSNIHKKTVAFIACLLFSFFWGGILVVIGLNLQTLILILPYLWFIRFFWKTIVGGNKLIIPSLYMYLIASLLPFGTFYIDWKYLRS